MTAYEPTIAQACFGNKWEEHNADHLTDDLYSLSELLGKRDPEAQHHGLLGGSYGYGQDFKNAVFEMHPYDWGGCACGFEAREIAWCEEHSHLPDCYQADLESVKKTNPYKSQIEQALALRERHDFCSAPFEEAQKEVDRLWKEERAWETEMYKNLCKKHGIAYNGGSGCAVHCTCGRDDEYQTWRTANDHDPECPVVLPNFRHFASGLEVHFYKYIGRGMSSNKPITKREFRKIIQECEASVE